MNLGYLYDALLLLARIAVVNGMVVRAYHDSRADIRLYDCNADNHSDMPASESSDANEPDIERVVVGHA